MPPSSSAQPVPRSNSASAHIIIPTSSPQQPGAPPQPSIRRLHAQRDALATARTSSATLASFTDSTLRPTHITTTVVSIATKTSTASWASSQPAAPVLLVDGYSLAFRAWHGMNVHHNGGLWTSDRTPTSVTHGVLKTLQVVCRQYRPRAVLVAFDKGASFRRDLAALLAPLCEAPAPSTSKSSTQAASAAAAPDADPPGVAQAKPGTRGKRRKPQKVAEDTGATASSGSSGGSSRPSPDTQDGGGGGMAALLTDEAFITLCKELQKRLLEDNGLLNTQGLRQALMQFLPPGAQQVLDMPISEYSYKAGRTKAPIEFYQDTHNLQCVLCALRIPCLTVPHVEADDTLATLASLAHQQGHPVLIMTSDQDLLQLVDDRRRVRVLLVGKPGSWAGAVHARKPYMEMGEAEVHAKLGVRPAQFAEWRALVGDKSDNIPGVPGIGEVNASKLIREFAGLDGIYQALREGRVQAKAAARHLAQGVRHAYLSLLLSKLGSVHVRLTGHSGMEAAQHPAGREAPAPAAAAEATGQQAAPMAAGEAGPRGQALAVAPATVEQPLFALQGFRCKEVMPVLQRLELRELALRLEELQELLGGKAQAPLDEARLQCLQELRLGPHLDVAAAAELAREFADEDVQEEGQLQAVGRAAGAATGAGAERPGPGVHPLAAESAGAKA